MGVFSVIASGAFAPRGKQVNRSFFSKKQKIYEGDIVCFKNRGKYNDDRDEVLAKHIKEKSLKKTFLAQIFFKNEGGGYCIKRQTKRGHTKYFSLFDMSFYLDFRLKVVGNIHENADLLNNHNKEQKCH